MPSHPPLRESRYGVAPAWLLHQAPLLTKPRQGAQQDVGLLQQSLSFDACIQTQCDAKPTFRRGVGGTFIMELAGVFVKMTTTCDPHPSFSGAVFFRPVEDFFVELPEVRQVVFDPCEEIPHRLSMTAGACKCVTLLEVPDHDDLKATIRTNTPSGSLVLEDVSYIGNSREVVAEVALNFDLKANSKISIIKDSGIHRLNVEFDFQFQCWLDGSALPACIPSDANTTSVKSDSKTALELLHSPSGSFEAPPSAENNRQEQSYMAQLSQGQLQEQKRQVQLQQLQHRRELLRQQQEQVQQDYLKRQEQLRQEQVHQEQLRQMQLQEQLRQMQLQHEKLKQEELQQEQHSGGHLHINCDAPKDPPHSDAQAKRRAYVSSACRLSFASTTALKALDSTDEELSRIETRVKVIASLLPDVHPSSIFPLKAELAQLETEAKKLETKGIDDIYTGDLTSGKHIAKDAKKAMLLRFEQLFGTVEQIFADMQAKVE